MKCLEQITIVAKSNLSTLWDIVKKRFPCQTVYYKPGKNNNTLNIKYSYRSVFSQILALWLHQNRYEAVLQKMVDEYEIISMAEKEYIFLSAKKRVEEEHDRFSKILQGKILCALQNNHSLNLEGFFHFCMQEYWEEMEIIVEECIDSYLSEQDYLEFLDLLKYYIAVEEYRFGHLFVVAQADGKYQYYDEDSKNITTECLGRFLLECEDYDADPDDCLITILILLLPKRITIYGAEKISNKKFLNTLQNIFENRIEIQKGTEFFVKNNL